ncbi:hypothetical protein GF371_00360 [Candidatus Woesearchaeota archaeon]|nr:hypothetical protein [Candidatus Woesearchaeota archaeon]
MKKRGGKSRVSRSLFLIFLFSLFVISACFVSATCCVNEQTSFTSTAVDVTCIDNLPSTQCFSGFFSNATTCKDVQQCGCCVCNYGSANPTVYKGGDLRVSNNFCAAFCAPYSYNLIPGLTTASCSQQENATGISGYVFDSDGNPVHGAQVTETGGSSDVTDAQGKYSLSVFQQTTTVTASKANVQNNINVNVATKKTGWNITLDLAAVSADLVGKITPLISGVPSPTPLSNVVVTVTDGVNQFATETDVAGEYEFIAIPISDYALTANRCGFFPESAQVSVTAPLTRKDISLRSAPQETLTGVVKDLQNRPVKDADIAISPKRGIVQKSDEQGIYRVTNLDSNCQYTVTATKAPQYQDSSKTKSIYATDPLTTNTLDFVLEPSVMFDFCTDIGDCRGEDLILGTPDDCGCPPNYVCNQLTGNCDRKPTIDCCDYDFLCQPPQARSGVTAQCGSEKETCSNVCAEIINCPADEKLSNQNTDGVCKCAGETVTILQSLADQYGFENTAGKYCCPFSPVSISEVPCEFQQKAAIVGIVVSRIDGEPIDATVTADPNTAGEQSTMSSSVDGSYVLFVDPNIDHTINFKRPPLYEPETRVVRAGNLAVGETFTLDVSLGIVARTCDYPSTPEVPDFVAENVVCKNQARLTWNNEYCRNTDGVQSFIITADNLNKTYVVSPDNDELIIKDLDWNELYSFSIQAKYSDHNSPRTSRAVAVSGFDPGDEECDGRCDSEEFCLDNTKRRMCDQNNHVTTDLLSPNYFPDCEQHQQTTGSDYAFVCIGSGANKRTKCVEQSKCGFDLTNPVPFLGLLFNSLKCSKNPATKNDRGCYMDRSGSVKNFCYPCPDSENITCSDYKSKYACEQNKCLVPEDCIWYSPEFTGMGEGFCVDSDTLSKTKYKQREQMTVNLLNETIKQSKCSLCSKQGKIFNNVGCEQDACSRLGFCYAELDNKNISSCVQCSFTPPVTTCNDFKTEESCISATGENQEFVLFSSSLPESAKYSDDACGIGRCIWDDQRNGCYKDGNGDGQADCVTIEFGVEAFNPICELDIIPPTTTPNSDTLILGNASDRNTVNFTVSEAISNFYYCIYKEGGTRCSVMKKISGTNSNRVKGNVVSVRPVEEFKNAIYKEGNYRIRYYAEDASKNKELLKEVAVFVDTKKPGITIQNQSVCVNCDLQIDCSAEESYLSKLVLSIQSDELVACKAYFIEPGDSLETTTQKSDLMIDIATSGILSYPRAAGASGLEDGNYRLYLQCEDVVGNEFKKQYFFKIDQLKGIKNVKPVGPIKNTAVRFEADTVKPSDCTISVDGGSRIKMDQLAGGRKHALEKNFVENSYHYYNIRCDEKYSITPNRCDSERYEFSIDNSAPATVARINDRLFDEDGWTIFLTDPAILKLYSTDESVKQNRIQFGADHIAYCYREDLLPCVPGQSVNSYRVFADAQSGTAEIKIPVDKNLKMCYHAIDKGGRKETTKCGKILFTVPPSVDLISPVNDYVTNKLHITVNATHDADNATDPLITTFNGEDFIAVAAQLIDSQIYGILTFLFPGLNRVSARVRDGAGVFGEDTVNVYYDKEGPSIQMTSDEVIEYNQPFLLSAEIKDLEWTSIDTADNIGEVTDAVVAIQSPVMSRTYNMTKQGSMWSAYIVPSVDSAGFADFLPGKYSITFNAKDGFGNENSKQYEIEIKDTIPANITIDLLTPNIPLPPFREEDVFYTKERMPVIRVRTTEPAECQLRISSIAPTITEDFVTNDSRTHLFSSQNLLSFSPGKEQRFSAQIVCRDLFAQTTQDTNIVIDYDDVAPNLQIFSSEGKNKIHKKGTVYLLSERNNVGDLSTRISVTDARRGEEIKCGLNCSNRGKSCGTHHQNSVLPVLGEDTFKRVQEEIIDYDLEVDKTGEFNYLLTCTDKAKNAASGEFTILVEKEEPTVNLTLPTIGPEPGINLQSADTGSPVIADIGARTIYNKLGVIADSQRENYKKFIIVDGKSGNTIPVQLIADVSERTVCRYSTSMQDFNQMQNRFSSDDYVFYPRTPYLSLADGSTYTYYVGCRDEAGNLAAPYTVDIEVDLQEPVRIFDAEPAGHINNLPVVNAYTYRNVQCTYDHGTKTGLPMRTIKTSKGYLHTSAQFSGNVLFVPEGTETSVTIDCGQGSGLLPATETVRFTVDKTSPNIVLSSPVQGQAVDAVVVDLTGSTEPLSEIDVYVNKIFHRTIKTEREDFEEEIFLERDGNNIIDLFVIDKAGNKALKTVSVDANGPNLAVKQIVPVSGKIGDLTGIVASIDGDDFNEEMSEFTVLRNDIEISGELSYSPERNSWKFVPDQGYLSDGDYLIAAIPVNDFGEKGFGKRAEFTVQEDAPKIEWIYPEKENGVLSSRLLKPAVEFSTISSTAPVTDAEVYVQNRIRDGTGFDRKRYNFARTKDDAFTSKLDMAEGINYLRIKARNLYGETDYLRGVFVDTAGPRANIEPKGTITMTRPEITAKFQEDVKLKYYDLIEVGSILQNLTRGMSVTKKSMKEYVFDIGAQLRSGTYLFTIGVEDALGNPEESQQEFVVNVGELDLELLNPKYEVSPEPVFDFRLKSNQDANCRYSQIYDSGVHTSIYTFNGLFDQTGQVIHVIENLDTITAEYPGYKSFYVWCESVLSKTISQPVEYRLSIDETKPEIIDLYAEPAPVTEQPLQTTLYVETDDETRCRFECNTDVVNYNSMENEFSEEFSTTHSVEMNLVDKTDYECNIACMNLAELVSETEKLEFKADTGLGAGLRIVSPEHDSAYPPGPVELLIKSQNLAQCSYTLDDLPPVEFPAISRQFNTTFEDLLEGEHNLEVSCVYSVGSDTISSTFYIDDTPPSEIWVEDGDYACSGSLINVTWEAEDPESGILEYEYAVRSELSEDYDVRNFTKTKATTVETPLQNLSSGRYYFAVRAKNRAGLWTELIESDGVLVDDTLNICAEEAPPIAQLQVEELAGKTVVSIVCSDEKTGCAPDMYYGTSPDMGACEPAQLYNGSLELYETQQFCYLVSDLAGNEVTGEETIIVLPAELVGCPNDLDCDEIINEEDPDIDGDGILNCEDDDDDNDGILDYDLATNYNTDFDDDNDGVNDDLDYHTNNDLDLDGLPNGVDDDDDCDGISDCDDPDDDNDGILDVDDLDDDNDGVPDVDDQDSGASLTPDDDNDLDDDGISNAIDEDIDGDGILNEDDADMDNDGVPDCIDQDNDNDGILDKEDPDYSDDFDEDGLPNRWEEQYGLDKVNSADAGMDNDNDGLKNVDEFKFKTNPLNKDTDEDGHTDYDELFKYEEQYDPADPESKPPSRFLFYLILVIILLIVGFIGYYGYQILYVKRKEKLAAKRAEEQRRLREEARRKAVPPPKPAKKPAKAAAPAPPKPKKLSPLEKRILKMKRIREQRRKEREEMRDRLFGKFETAEEKKKEKEKEKKAEKKPEEKAEKKEKPKKAELKKKPAKPAKPALAPEFKKLSQMVKKGRKIKTIAQKLEDLKMPKKKVDRLGELIEKRRGKKAKDKFDELVALKKKR